MYFKHIEHTSHVLINQNNDNNKAHEYALLSGSSGFKTKLEFESNSTYRGSSFRCFTSKLKNINHKWIIESVISLQDATSCVIGRRVSAILTVQ